MSPAVDIIYIMGAGRSGSTVFERVLASHDGTAVAGEAERLWERSLDDELLCSCRVPIKECPFWRAVAETAMPGPDAIRAVKEVRRTRRLHLLHHGVLQSRRYEQQLRTAQAAISSLYDALVRAADGRVIIDSSKVPAYAHLLSTMPGLRVLYVHFVRDSRAVAHSFTRVRVRPEITWERAEMGRRPPWRTAYSWNVRFALSLALRPYVGKALMQVRYEDFVRNPDAVVERIRARMDRLGMRPLGPRREDADPAWYHSFQGNPIRFDQRPLQLREDVEWREKLPARSKLLVTALTAPFLALHATRIGFR